MALSIKSKDDGTIRFYHEGDNGLLAVFPTTHSDARTGKRMALSLDNGMLGYVDAETAYVRTLKGASDDDRLDAQFMVDFINSSPA